MISVIVLFCLQYSTTTLILHAHARGEMNIERFLFSLLDRNLITGPGL